MIPSVGVSSRQTYFFGWEGGQAPVRPELRSEVQTKTQALCFQGSEASTTNTDLQLIPGQAVTLNV